MTFIRRNSLLLATIAYVSLLYFSLTQSFFQQDEWHHLGREYLWHERGFTDFVASEAISPFGVRLLPFAHTLNYFQFSFFGQNPLGYALVSLFLHLANSLLVYLVTLQLTKSKRVAFIGSVLFATASTHTQAITWLIQHSTTLPALTFSLFSIYFFLRSLESDLKRYFIYSLVFLGVAVCFKETALFLFPFLIYVWLIWPDRKERSWWAPVSIGVVGAVYFTVLTVLTLTQPVRQVEGLVSKVIRLDPHLLVKVVGQSFLPENFWLWFSSKIANLVSLNQANEVIGVSMLVFVFIFAGGVLLSLFIVKRIHLLFSVGLILLGSFPLLFVAQTGSVVFLASRYLYIPVVGASLLTALVVNRLFKLFGRFTWLFVVIIVLVHSVNVFSRLQEQVSVGRLRLNILRAIKFSRPELPDKVIFYTESDVAYYGLAPDERILPFQSGLGQTLMIWYQPTEHFPVEFFEGEFLWGISDQGYQEIGGRGFGYFRDFGLLIQTIIKENLPIDSVIAFRYDSSGLGVEDMTDEVRGRLGGYFTNKSEIDLTGVLVVPSENREVANSLLDGDRQTFWVSKQSYRHSQFLEIDLGIIRKVAQVTLDSYNNQDQNEVGYSLLLSVDGVEFQEVFYAKRYPPNEEGKVNLYMKPQAARFIRIEQKGFHKSANWVIGEITIYEAM